MQISHRLYSSYFQQIKYPIKLLWLALWGIFLISCSQSPEKEINNIIGSHSNLIRENCRLYNIPPRVYASIIYGELKNNYDEWDRFDSFRARIGMDPSVGFAQIKVSTFVWIEDNYANEQYISKSNSKDELIDKMLNDSINIRYSAFYMKLISDKFSQKFKINPSVKTLASYYGKGIDYYKGDTLDSSYYNQVGITSEKFYISNNLVKEFPLPYKFTVQ